MYSFHKTVQGECPRCTLLCSTAISGHRFLPSLCSLLSRPLVPQIGTCTAETSPRFNLWEGEKSVEEACACPLPEGLGPAASLRTLFTVHWTGKVTWLKGWREMESALVLRRKWILVDWCCSPLSFPFLFLILFSFQISRLHSAPQKCIFSSSLPFLLLSLP